MLPKSLEQLIDNLSKLPGVGRKTAERYAYFLLRSHRGLARELGETLINLPRALTLCSECFYIAEPGEDGVALCNMCRMPRRDKNQICVVEQIFDAEAIERSGEHHGLYHVLHGRIAPLDNMVAEDIKIKELVARVKRLTSGGQIPEIILATNPSTEGDVTALFIHQLLKPLGVKLTRIATGIPMGADIEYADEITLGRALKGRQNFE